MLVATFTEGLKVTNNDILILHFQEVETNARQNFLSAQAAFRNSAFLVSTAAMTIRTAATVQTSPYVDVSVLSVNRNDSHFSHISGLRGSENL